MPEHMMPYRTDGGNMPDPRDPHVLPESYPKTQWRLDRAYFLINLWDHDRRGFDLWAGDYAWEDPDIVHLLPSDAAGRAVRLASRAAIALFQRQHGAQS